MPFSRNQSFWNRIIAHFINYTKKPGSWFLLALVLTIGFYTFFSVSYQFDNDTARSESQLSRLYTILVLNRSADTFGQNTYLVFSNGNFWQAYSDKGFLEVGRSYRINGRKQRFSLIDENKFQSYILSLGVSGRLKIDQVQAKNLNCDLICSMIENRQWIHSQVLNTYANNSCHDFYTWNLILDANQNLCRDNYALSMGLVMGGSDYFSDSFRQSFKTLGLSHLVAFSGFQVVLITGWLEYWLVKLRLEPKLRLVFIVIVCILIIWLIGALPPVIRSVTSMITNQSALILVGRRLSALRGLIYSAIIMLAFNPLYALNISFQLSFLATLAIITVSEGGEQEVIQKTTLLAKPFHVIRETAIQSLAAFAFTYPVISTINNHNSPISILTNALIVPIINLLTLMNVLSLIPFLGDAFAFATTLLQFILIKFINLAGHTVIEKSQNLSGEWNIFPIIVILLLILLNNWRAKKR